MIHKNRGNRRWVDKRKRKHKYNLCQRVCGDAMYWLGGILGAYDKGKIHSTDHWKKTNGRVAMSDCDGNTGYVGTLHRMGNNYSHSDKKKVESCNDKVKEYTDGFDEMDAMIAADIESYYDWWKKEHEECNESPLPQLDDSDTDWWVEGYNDDEWYMQKRYCNCEPYTNYINVNSNEKEE